MAKVIMLSDGLTTTADFINGTLQIIYDTWQTTYQRDEKRIESFNVLAKNGAAITDNTIIDAVELLNDTAWKARNWTADRLNYTPVWFYAYSAAETPKRCLVFDCLVTPLHIGGHTPAILGTGGAIYNVTLTCKVQWEDATAIAGNNANTSAFGGCFAVAAPTGSLEPRIYSLEMIGGGGVGETEPYSRIWAGIKPNYNINTDVDSEFQPVWELQFGTLGTDAVLATDADGSPAGAANNVVNVSFATTTTNAKRLAITGAQAVVAYNATHQLGRFNVLLRCKCSVAQEVSIQMRAGYQWPAGSTLPSSQAKPFSETNFRILDLGEIQIPTFSWRAPVDAANLLQNYTIEIWAERVGTAVTLTLDAIILMPVEHYTYSENNQIKLVAPTEYQTCRHFVFPDDETLAIGELESSIGATSAVPYTGLIPDFRNWTIPRRGGMFVFVAERESSHVISDECEIYYDYYRRYRTHNASGSGT